MTGTRQPPAIRFDKVSKAFGQQQVLNQLSCEVGVGENLVILGQSGAGKSVLLKCALGLLPTDSGHIELRGSRQPNVLDEGGVPGVSFGGNRGIGVLFQKGALFDSLTVEENILFPITEQTNSGHTWNLQGNQPGRQDQLHQDERHGKQMRPKFTLFRKRPSRAMLEWARHLMHDVGIPPEFAGYFPAELSGGQQKRVALARALAAQPDILFFDEPTTGLDPIRSHRTDRLIQDVLKKTGATAITITHDITSTRRIADRVALLVGGQIQWSGPVKEMDSSNHAMMQQFVRGELEGAVTNLRQA